MTDEGRILLPFKSQMLCVGRFVEGESALSVITACKRQWLELYRRDAFYYGCLSNIAIAGVAQG